MASHPFPSTLNKRALGWRIFTLCAALSGCASPPADGDASSNHLQKMQFAAGQLCFSPLQNPASKDRANWDDLVNRNVDEASGVLPAKHVERILKLRDGIGDKFNLDYFALTFSAPPGKTVPEFFLEMRLAFPLFAGATGEEIFRPYTFKVLDPQDPDRIKNGKKWSQVDHTGALMTFVLVGLLSVSVTPISGNEVRTIGVQTGDVQSICSSPSDFIFATVETDTGTHPVSGIRGFGLKDNGDGTWTFYSKAADRRSDYWVNKPIVSKVFPDVFYEGRLFWDDFYRKMKIYLESKGLKVANNVFANCNLAEWNGTAMYACEPLKK